MPKSAKFLDVCKECKAYCCKAGGPKVSKKDRDKILKAGFKDCFVEVSNEVYAVKTKNDICPYLKRDYSCEIQKVKPGDCMAWPVIPGYKNSERFYMVAKCPLYAHLSKKAIEKAKLEASKIPINVIKEAWKLSPAAEQKSKKFEYEEI